MTDTLVEQPAPAEVPSGKRHGFFTRLYRAETTYDFYGKRRRGFALSLLLIAASAVSLAAQGLDLGIDFRGGVSWEVPSENFTVDEARAVLDANGIDGSSAKIQTLSRASATETRLRIQVGDQPEEIRLAVSQGFAEAAGVTQDDISDRTVSSAWGRSITEKAVRALVVFFVLVSLFIAWRFEWKMALAAFVAVVHDVVVSVGIYSLLGLEVTPATLVAFLTILGYSLYDTIVVFDKVKDNTGRYAGSRVAYADVMNVSMNQVLMRSLNTSISSLLPVVSLLIVGARFMGAIALQEFALALFIGLITGAYSSLFIASPVLALLKEREPRYRSLRATHLTGEAMHELSVHGAGSVRREHARTSAEPSAGGARLVTATGDVAADATSVLTHPPRPRKKRRR